MLELNDNLNFETIAKISSHGFSRIPVYEGKRDNIIGLLHVKDFTLLDPDDNMPVKAILEFYNHIIKYCDSDRLIDDMFEEFRKGETHLAFVTEVIQEDDLDPYVLCVGIITLEDILEELVQMEIYDEFDNKSDIENEEIQDREYSRKNSLDSPSKKLINIKYKSRDSENENISTNNSPKLKNYDTSKLNGSSDKENHIELKTLANSLRESMRKTKDYKTNLAKKLAPVNYESQASKDLDFFIQKDQQTIISSQIRFVMFQFLWTSK